MLIPGFQLYGAVIATLAGYFVIWLFIVTGTMKQTNVKFDTGRSCVLYGLLLVQWIVLLLTEYHYYINLMILAVVIVICPKEIKDVFDMMRKLLLSKIPHKGRKD